MEAGKAVTRSSMPLHIAAFHWTMIVATAGLWAPAYLAARRKRRTVTVYY